MRLQRPCASTQKAFSRHASSAGSSSSSQRRWISWSDCTMNALCTSLYIRDPFTHRQRPRLHLSLDSPLALRSRVSNDLNDHLHNVIGIVMCLNEMLSGTERCRLVDIAL